MTWFSQPADRCRGRLAVGNFEAREVGLQISKRLSKKAEDSPAGRSPVTQFASLALARSDDWAVAFLVSGSTIGFPPVQMPKCEWGSSFWAQSAGYFLRSG